MRTHQQIKEQLEAGLHGLTYEEVTGALKELNPCFWYFLGYRRDPDIEKSRPEKFPANSERLTYRKGPVGVKELDFPKDWGRLLRRWPKHEIELPTLEES